MIVHFAASSKSVVDDIETLRAIITTIHEHGHVVARDWIEPFRIAIQKGRSDVSPEEVYQFNMDAIARADLVIVEGSHVSFSSGFQVAAALARKKPVLILVNSSKVTNESILSQGITDPLLKRSAYTSVTLKERVSEFINDNTISTKDLRFNFVIDRQLYNHIRWKSFKTRKTKAEIVRELLMKDMESD